MSTRRTKPPLRPTFKSFIETNGDTALDGLDKSVTSTTTEASNTSCFYVALDEKDEHPLEVSLLPGEILISQATGVTQYVAYGNETSGAIGNLVVTNYRVSFVTIIVNNSMVHSRQNKLVGADDIILANISEIYQVSKGKRKRLLPNTLLAGSLSKMELHCKDFRLHSFCFRKVEPNYVKSVVNAILHHTFPTRPDLLFAIYYRGDTKQSDSRFGLPEFSSAADWEKELTRLNVQGYSVTQCNNKFQLSQSLPEYFVLPNSMSESFIKEKRFKKSKDGFPIWCYSHSNGSSLVCMVCDGSNDFENLSIDLVTGSHPKSRKPKIIDLSVNDKLPSIKELQSNYYQLRDICLPSSCQDIWSKDNMWLTLLESSQWLYQISRVLKVVHDVVTFISFDNRSVIIKEKDEFDFCPLVSSLAQLQMDPESRTIRGFQSLIEKDWVTLGHRFADRCGIVHTKDSDQQSPVFLLFLDCVWQILQQYPSSFEFSEIYLTTLWDSITLGMFRNFIFNSPAEQQSLSFAYHPGQSKKSSSPDSRHQLMSVWDWNKQFSNGDILAFFNPLYVTRQRIHQWRFSDSSFDAHYGQFVRQQGDQMSRSGSLSPRQSLDARKICRLKNPDLFLMNSTDVLNPGNSLPQLKFWEHCYLRWLTPIEIIGGGQTLEYVIQSRVMKDVSDLENEISKVRKSLQKLSTSEFNESLTSSGGSCQSGYKCDSPEVFISSSYPFAPKRPSTSTFFTMPIIASYGDLQDIPMDADNVSIDEYLSSPQRQTTV